MRLVVVHGRNQQFNDPAELRKKWIDAVHNGLRRNDFEQPEQLGIGFAYYGDVWRPDNVLDRGERADEQELESRIARQQVVGPPDAKLRRIAALDFLKLGKVIGLLDEYTGFTKPILKKHFRDVIEYLEFGNAREAILTIVDAAIQESEDDIVLLGHSLGSIVIYDWVMERQHSRVKGMLTFGSPLGLSAVRESLEVRHLALAFPDSVKVWYNILNPEDTVTAAEDLAPHYPSYDHRAVQDRKSDGKDIQPLRGDFNAPHDGFVYASSMPFGRSLRAMIEALTTV